MITPDMKHGVEKINENRIHLADFYSENKQVIGGIIFQRKETPQNNMDII